MSGGLDLLDELRAKFAALEVLPAEVAKLAAPLVEEALRATAREGTAPDGTPWQKKKGGGDPLVHAADHISTRAVGTVVLSTLSGVDVFHNYGAGVPRRPILPDPGTIPPKVEAALRKAADLAFEKATR